MIKSPGFDRMKKRMGAEKAEELRQQTLREQEEAMRGVRPRIAARDRETYKTYPKSKQEK